MHVPDLVGLFAQPLERLGVRYMITGGVAAVVYGDPRFTRDIDIVLEMAPADAPRPAAAFDPNVFYVPPLEALIEESERERYGHFNLIHRESALRAHIYLSGSDPLHTWGLANRRSLPLAIGTVAVAPAEYVIVRKLEYYRDSQSDRHLRDIAWMLRISGDQIDADFLERCETERDLSGEWALARNFEPAS
ncbi:MAG: nucleotidyl transferase AbiEii/AbiGii toxin family protein [Gemmatimonadales bacterium]